MPLFPRYDGPPLMDQVCGVENLTLAWRRVRSNIQVWRRSYSAGIDAVTLRDFEADWTRQMAQLADELRNGSYRPLPPRRVSIPKASGGERAIAILAVRDRIAQRAVQQVLEPLFDPLFLDCSYGCRPHVGVPEAVARVNRYAAQGLVWAVDADLTNYFGQIEHRILLGLVRQRIGEAALLHLLAQWLSAGALTTAESAPIVDPHATPLARGGALIQRAVAWGMARQPMLGSPDPRDLYAAATWERPMLDGIAANGAWTPPALGLEQHLWTAVTLAKPVMTAAQMALPHVRRLDLRRLAMMAAVTAGAAATVEVIARNRVARRGTVQGGALSPLLANTYLHPFDLALTSQGLRLVRFMDDFVIMCASQGEAEAALVLAQRQLATLRLTLNADKTRLVNYDDGLEFLGQALAPRKGGPYLEQGLTSFEDAQRKLQAAAENVRRYVKRRT
ncbi:MAG TPA: reverse transcriptase domain-containing protein [Roseiflexaceae bacterium]|jgi:RNA-directed DNA polymerase